MKPEAQRIAIAEACGEVWEKTYEFPIQWKRNGVRVGPHISPPDYLNDLNAMHAVVDHLNATQPDKWNDEYFLQTLCGWTKGFPHHATAEQWAEAVLRTLNLWKA